MSGRHIEIYSGEELVDTVSSLSDYAIGSDYTVIAYADGRASGTTVNNGGKFEISGGKAQNTTVKSGGSMLVKSGDVSGIAVRAGGTLTLNGEASDISIMSSGEVYVLSGGKAKGVNQYVNSSIVVENGGMIEDSVQRNGTLTMNGGNAKNITMYYGELIVGAGATAAGVVQFQDGSIIEVLTGGILQGAICSGAMITVSSGAVAVNSTLSGYEIESGGIYRAVMVLSSGAIHRGRLILNDWSEVEAEAGAVIDFTLTGTTPDSAVLISGFSRISGTPDFTMTVTANQAVGVYALASSVSAFSAPVALQCESYSALNLAVGETATYHDRVYSLSLTNAELTVDVADYTTSATANQLNWNEINNAVSYAVELSGGSHNIEVEIGTQGADLLGLANGDYTWQVRNIEEEDNLQTGEAFSQTSAPQEPQVLSAETNTLTDVFFADVDGTWGKGFEAMHVGCKDGWTGTLETVNLAGKSRITDIFAGSDDASILVLTDDSENGMALFVDDIYSAACGTPEQARLSKIDTIYATAGDDIIDLSSQSFEFANGATVYGGSGDDVIWANSKENMLFGEAGDDRIVGGNEDDVIIGGIGNDTLHGGGGADVFCFGDGWGVDTVEQLASGSVVLWFNENSGTWDEANLTYTQGDNSVSVFGVASVELRFGSAEGHEEQYAVLSASGAFA